MLFICVLRCCFIAELCSPLHLSDKHITYYVIVGLAVFVAL